MAEKGFIFLFEYFLFSLNMLFQCKSIKLGSITKINSSNWLKYHTVKIVTYTEVLIYDKVKNKEKEKENLRGAIFTEWGRSKIQLLLVRNIRYCFFRVLNFC